MPDFKKYIDQIIEPQDIILIEEADKAVKCGALRAAYIMIWIACAESIKRRFRKAGERDSNAGKVTTEIQKRESRHESIDQWILEESKKYGFITDSEHTELKHIYEMRCVYGHPYEQVPSEEQVIHAIAIVVKNVLSREVKMHEGFVSYIIDKMLKEKHYLDDQDAVVSDFAKEIMLKIDKSVFKYMFNKYWKELEAIARDATMTIFYRRGIVFTSVILSELGFEVLTEDEWHDKVCNFPYTLIEVLTSLRLYSKVGEKAQDALVGKIIEISQTRSSILCKLEYLESQGFLSQRQEERFHKQIEIMNSSKLYKSNLSLSLCVNRILQDLGTKNYYIQNPAVEFIELCGFEQVGLLDLEKQCLLGRNILQAAEGSAIKAESFITDLSVNPDSYSFNFIEGIVLECFVNENDEIRFKFNCLEIVLEIVDKLNADEQRKILNNLEENIKRGRFKDNFIRKSLFEELISLLDSRLWYKNIKVALQEKMQKYQSTEE